MSTITVKSRVKDKSWLSTTCPYCKSELEYQKPASQDFSIECASASCQKSFQLGTTGKRPKSQKVSRRIGTDANPIDLTYYNILQVKIDATEAEIKSAYRRLALKKHPDKIPAHLRTPAAEEEFKLLASAYKVLSDPVERKKYNEFGISSRQAEDGFVDPEELFSTLFGGERFQDIIGTISIGQDMKSSLQKVNEEDEAAEAPKKAKKDMTPEEKAAQAEEERKEAAERAKIREERVSKLVDALLKKMAIFTEQASNGGNDPQVVASVKAIWAIEVEELKDENFGVELLQSVGSVYQAKARHYRSSQSTPLGIGGWFRSVQSTAHVFSDTISTLRSAYELTDIFKELQAAEEKGLSDEQRKELEEKAATKGLQALFKGCKLEVESIIREVCDRIMYDTKVDQETILKRVTALEILGGVYASVQKDENAPDLLGFSTRSK